ncbi:MAG: LmeA family phospholipid-binding protein [Actinomycetota bacterium]
MRLLRFVMIVLAGLWLVGEIAVIPFAESRIESEVADRTRDATAVEANIGSFPLASRVLITGKVPKLTVTLERVARQALTFAEVRFEVFGIHVDRTAILRGQARIEDIDRGTVTATIELGALGRIAESAGVQARVEGRTLLVGGVSRAIARDLVPCAPDARIEDQNVILSCTIDEVPDILLESVQGG